MNGSDQGRFWGVSSSHSDLTPSREKSKELPDICSKDIFPSLTLTALAAFVFYLMTQKSQFVLCWEFILRKSDPWEGSPWTTWPSCFPSDSFEQFGVLLNPWDSCYFMTTFVFRGSFTEQHWSVIKHQRNTAASQLTLKRRGPGNLTITQSQGM